MPRITRGIIEGYAYHIINRGNARQCVFHNNFEYQAFVDLMIQAKQRHPLKIISYCLMPNHFHLVIIPEHIENVSKFMQWLLTSHVRRVHKTHETSGHIWQGRFKSFIIQNDHHLLTVIRYVEANPKRAKLVNRAEGWEWSSLTKRRIEKNSLLLDDSPILLLTDWENIVNSDLSLKELETIHNSIQRQSPFGCETWVKDMAEELWLQSTIRPRGRPQKRGQATLF